MHIKTGTAEHYRIVDTAEHKVRDSYVTLSHSWGRLKFLSLTRGNEAVLMGHGFPRSALGNKNFEEAIDVAQHMGVEYIWIDSLCICQGDGGDFATEGQYMHKVYQNSLCNIVAAASRDSTGGLFRAREPNFVTDLDDIDSTEKDSEAREWMVLDKDLWSERLLQSPIYTRGWVFQGRDAVLFLNKHR